MNNFKQLYLEEEKVFGEVKSRNIGYGIAKTLDTYRYVGRVAEVFTSGFFDSIQAFLSPPSAKNIVIKKATVVLTVDTDYKTFTQEDALRLINIIRRELKLRQPIRYLGYEFGSVLLTLEMSDEEAEKLIIAIKTGRLKDHGITDARLKEFITIKSIMAGAQSMINDAIAEFKQMIKGLLAENRILEALNELVDSIKKESEAYNELVLLQSRYNHLEREVRTRQMGIDEIDKRRNQFCVDTIAFLKTINDKNFNMNN